MTRTIFGRRTPAAPSLPAIAAGLGVICASPATANDFTAEMEAAFERHVRPWLAAPTVIDAIRTQNREHADLAAAEIAALDARWRGEADAGGGPLVEEVMDAPLSEFLRARQAEATPLLTEMFVMDNRGLNVGASTLTSDYMQGDEDKWLKTYGAGPGAVHVGDLEFDESTETFQAQYSATVVDPATGESIGAITVGMRIESLL